MKTLGEFSARTLTKTTKKQWKLFTTVSIEQENNGRQHVFMAFTVSNSVGKMLGKYNVRAPGKTIEKRSGKLAVH